MSRILFTGLFFILTLTGCASSPFSNGGDESYPDSGAQRDWFPLPASGEQITVTNNASSLEEQVTVLDAYYAASGRTCSLYTETGGTFPTGLACRDADRWVVLPFIVNPDARSNNG